MVNYIGIAGWIVLQAVLVAILDAFMGVSVQGRAACCVLHHAAVMTSGAILILILINGGLI
ncbi:MAG: hypothetical protein A2W25_12050 [candidate division Zixibacteria bacterium RBG_16_53_22]|nr:MAG: hypothetical protein A2W25_12050 [candidate division Zixibacteria bacterium RBG_16_53_22]